MVFRNRNKRPLSYLILQLFKPIAERKGREELVASGVAGKGFANYGAFFKKITGALLT